jgi:large subunit ribosomal protein L6
MSRIGKKVITLPEKTEIAVSGINVTVKGPKGTLERTIHPDVTVVINGKEVSVTPKNLTADMETIRGTVVAHIANMIKGVNELFTTKLILEGIGYKADVKGTSLALALGFSHPVNIPIPASLKITSDKGIVTISGINKDEVGQFAANIRSLKKPEPYKGKGFRYDTEVIRRKQGKKSV